jgi:hypothetical protein
LAKVANLEFDAKSYWLYRNVPFENRKPRETSETAALKRDWEYYAGGLATDS